MRTKLAFGWPLLVPISRELLPAHNIAKGQTDPNECLLSSLVLQQGVFDGSRLFTDLEVLAPNRVTNQPVDCLGHPLPLRLCEACLQDRKSTRLNSSHVKISY